MERRTSTEESDCAWRADAPVSSRRPKLEPHADHGDDILQIFGKQEPRGRGARPPGFDPHPLRDHRKRNQRDAGKLVRRARPWRAACGSWTSRRSATGSRARCTQRRVSTALPMVLSAEWSRSTQQANQRWCSGIRRAISVGPGGRMHAGDQQAPAAAGGQQFERVVDAGGAAGQHHDAVGRCARATASAHRQLLDEPEEARSQQHGDESDKGQQFAQAVAPRGGNSPTSRVAVPEPAASIGPVPKPDHSRKFRRLGCDLFDGSERPVDGPPRGQRRHHGDQHDLHQRPRHSPRSRSRRCRTAPRAGRRRRCRGPSRRRRRRARTAGSRRRRRSRRPPGRASGNGAGIGRR